MDWTVLNVRNKLLGGFLLVAMMVAATAGIALHADADSARKAAVTEAVQVAEGISSDVAVGLAADTTGEVRTADRRGHRAA